MKTQVCRVWAMALAVLLGMASRGAAVDIDVKATEIKLCLAKSSLCGATCLDNDDGCITSTPFLFCEIQFQACEGGCRHDLDNCLSSISKSTARQYLGIGAILSSNDTIAARIGTLSLKLDNLAAQVGAVSPVDLVPLPGIPGSTNPLDFCQSTTFQELDVHVANQGSSPAPASTTHVEFANSGGVDMPTPALAPGASAIVTFAIPATCFNAVSQCSFTIVVDSANVVTESNETNNSAAGLCQSS